MTEILCWKCNKVFKILLEDTKDDPIDKRGEEVTIAMDKCPYCQEDNEIYYVLLPEFMGRCPITEEKDEG